MNVQSKDDIKKEPDSRQKVKTVKSSKMNVQFRSDIKKEPDSRQKEVQSEVENTCKNKFSLLEE